jgi:hypothetical protein
LNPPKKKDLIISSRETVEIIQSPSKRWLAGYWNIDTTMKKKKGESAHMYEMTRGLGKKRKERPSKLIKKGRERQTQRAFMT